MRILYVIPYFYLSWAGGGAVELVQNIAGGLVERGHDVTIFTTNIFNGPNGSGSIPARTELNDHGLRICEFKALRGVTLGLAFHLSPALIPALARQTGAFDLIHLHEYRTFQNVVAHHYAMKFEVPYVLQAHGSLPTATGKRLLKRVYDGIWGRKLLSDAAKVVAVSRMEAQQCREFGVSPDRIEIVPNGLDLSVFDELPERGSFRHKHGLSEQRIVLFLGRLHQLKGLDLLAKAFSQLVKSESDITMVIAGPDAGYSSSLKRQVADLGIAAKVLFTGPLYGQPKLEAFVDADVYVLPSYYEIFSVTVLEACACGTPVIVTDRCALADVIEGQAGLVVPCNENRLARAIHEILSDDELGRRLGDGGRRLVHERFSLAGIITQLERVYRETLEHTDPR